MLAIGQLWPWLAPWACLLLFQLGLAHSWASPFPYRNGPINPLGINSNCDRIPFHIYCSVKDIIGQGGQVHYTDAAVGHCTLAKGISEPNE